MKPKYTNPAAFPYQCGGCGVSGCKLWRDSRLGPVDARCATCALKSEGLPRDPPIDEAGKRVDRFGHHTDQIGSLMPAVPCDGGWWAYTAVPDDSVAWWRALPTYPPPLRCSNCAEKAGDERSPR